MDMNDDSHDDSPGIDLSIEELALHGVPHAGRGDLERAFRRELGRLLTSEPLRDLRSGRIELRHPLQMNVAPGATASRLGHGLARAVHGALRRS